MFFFFFIAQIKMRYPVYSVLKLCVLCRIVSKGDSNRGNAKQRLFLDKSAVGLQLSVANGI